MHKSKRKAVELYERYENLAEKYAKHLYNYENLGMTQEDVVQELKEKIWYSILKFAKKWAEYRKVGKYKPVPLPFYIQSNLKKVIIDLSKKINGYSTLVDGTKHQKVKGIISMSDVGFDIGTSFSYDTNIDFTNKNVIIQGVDILEGLDTDQKRAYIMHLKGHNIQRIQSICRSVDVSDLIVCQREKLSQRRSELLSEDNRTYISFSSRDENV